MRSSMLRLLVVTVALALAVAGCGDSGEESGDTVGTPATSQSSGANGDGGDGGSGDGGSTSATSAPDSAQSGGDGDGQTTVTNAGEGPDMTDALDLIGNPDLELEDLPEDVQDALDEIDDFVSLTDCSSEVVGLRVDIPENWDCRGLDNPVGDMDAFTLFTDANTLTVTIGSGPGIFACEFLGGCPDEVFFLSDNFPNTFMYSAGPATEIGGQHASVDAYVLVTSNDAISDEEMVTIAGILDSAEPFPG